MSLTGNLQARLPLALRLVHPENEAPEAAALLGAEIFRLSGDPLRATVLALMALRTPEALELLYALTRSKRETVRLAAKAGIG